MARIVAIGLMVLTLTACEPAAETKPTEPVAPAGATSAQSTEPVAPAAATSAPQSSEPMSWEAMQREDRAVRQKIATPSFSSTRWTAGLASARSVDLAQAG